MPDNSALDDITTQVETRVNKTLLTLFGWQINSHVILFNGILALGTIIAACVIYFVLNIQDYTKYVPEGMVVLLASIQPYINIVLRIWKSGDNPIMRVVGKSVTEAHDNVNVDLDKVIADNTHQSPTPATGSTTTAVPDKPVVVPPTPEPVVPTPAPVVAPPVVESTPTPTPPIVDPLVKPTEAVYSDATASGSVSTIGVIGVPKSLTQAFYDHIQPKLFPHLKNLPDQSGLLQKHKDGLVRLYNECIAQGVTAIDQIAYVLTTCYHESQRPIHGIWLPTMSPVEELGLGHGLKYGVPAGPYNLVYYGRGDIQTTWYDNYVKFTNILVHEFGMQVDLARHPELCLDPKISAIIAVYGMKHGTFTGVRLDTYINAKGTNFKGARHIVNGTDDDDLIAGQAVIMAEGLKLCL